MIFPNVYQSICHRGKTSERQIPTAPSPPSSALQFPPSNIFYFRHKGEPFRSKVKRSRMAELKSKNIGGAQDKEWLRRLFLAVHWVLPHHILRNMADGDVVSRWVNERSRQGTCFGEKKRSREVRNGFGTMQIQHRILGEKKKRKNRKKQVT